MWVVESGLVCKILTFAFCVSENERRWRNFRYFRWWNQFYIIFYRKNYPVFGDQDSLMEMSNVGLVKPQQNSVQPRRAGTQNTKLYTDALTRRRHVPFVVSPPLTEKFCVSIKIQQKTFILVRSPPCFASVKGFLAIKSTNDLGTPVPQPGWERDDPTALPLSDIIPVHPQADLYIP